MTTICAPIVVGNEYKHHFDVWSKDSSFAYEWVGILLMLHAVSDRQLWHVSV